MANEVRKITKNAYRKYELSRQWSFLVHNEVDKCVAFRTFGKKEISFVLKCKKVNKHYNFLVSSLPDKFYNTNQQDTGTLKDPDDVGKVTSGTEVVMMMMKVMSSCHCLYISAEQ
jgi:hypothetical protein